MDASKLVLLKQAKWLHQVVQEIDSIKHAFATDSQEIEFSSAEEEEIPPLPEDVLHELELTPDAQEAKKIYDNAMTLLNKTRPNKKEAYSLLVAASQKGNIDAKALVAWAVLFGNPLPQDLYNAKKMFTELSEKGHPDGHMGLGKYYI